MPWKINARGVFDYHEHDPEKIEEVDPPSLVAFGVTIESRCGQAPELACMLRFVCRLHDQHPATLLALERVFWDSKNSTATITMRDTVPASWLRDAAERLAFAFWAAGGCYWLSVEKPDGTIWEFMASEPGDDDEVAA
jgi:hypothetical protein